MTPEFEKRLEEKMNLYYLSCDSDNRADFKRAARWAYQQGIRDAVEKLRQGDWHGLADTLEREMMRGEEE